jgi:alpha-L-rhamnosidase
MRLTKNALLLTAAILLVRPAAAQTSSTIEGLRCEYLVNPLGIDVEKPRLSWISVESARGWRQSAYQILAASTPENLRKDAGDLWDSGKVNTDQSTWVTYAGKPLTSGLQVYWKVRVWDGANHATPWSGQAMWSMGLLHSTDWHARWIGEARPDGARQGAPLPFPWLRKTVTLAGKPDRATVYVNPQGYFELYINGKKVSDDVLSPAVSDYSKRNLYVTYDVTSYLVPGKNVVALWLGRGWYVRGHPGVINDGPLVRAQLDIALPGGAAVQVVTDDTWKLRESPITPLGRGLAFGDYGGEHYDTRLDLANWNGVALDDSDWKTAALFDPPPAITAAQMVEPNRIMETIPAVKVDAFPPGGYLIDMGREFTGWLEFRLPASVPAGTTVKLEYADAKRDPSGRGAATGGLQIANQRDEVVTNGSAFTFRSRLNYHGFRWVRVTGLNRAPGVQDAKGYMIRTAYSRAGEFVSSDQLMNRIYQLVTWTYQALTLGGYVVDCPTRERLGYGGDAGTSIENGMFNFSTGGLYNRWLSIWRDAQQPQTGALPHTAPNYQDEGGGGPMWGGFVVTAPWQLYLQYGDKRALETNYPMIQKWLGYLQSETVGNVLENHTTFAMRQAQWNFLGDWVTPSPVGGVNGDRGDPRSAMLINSLHYLYTVQIAAKVAAILGKPDDAAKYLALSADVERALHQRFYDAAKASYASGETAYLAFPLLVNVVPPELRKAVADNLEQTIRVKNAGHLDSGMHGTYFVLKYLMQADRNDLIYLMTSQKDYPGWGYMLAQGATTSWEDWRGRLSNIHDTLISIGSWFIQGIGGIRIDPQAPGFQHFLVEPALVGDLTFARTSYESIHGKIVSDWKIENGALHIDVTVPPGTTATVYVPTSAPDSVTEGGRPAAQSPGVKPAPGENGKAAFEVGSGKYAFTAKVGK